MINRIKVLLFHGPEYSRAAEVEYQEDYKNPYRPFRSVHTSIPRLIFRNLFTCNPSRFRQSLGLLSMYLGYAGNELQCSIFLI